MRRKNIIKLRDIVLVYQVIGILFLIKLFNNTMSSICCGSTFFFYLKIFKPVWFLFSFVLDYGNESETKENKS